MNRLANESSLYLRQHAENPVDWYPWTDEALARAASEDRPLLISIGYSACHWCHVMAHESFEDPETAAVMNAHFVCIKVDREERPDIDALYMQATLALSGHGGWPMTVFATPDGRPFYAGTYFPPTNRGSMPGMRELCAWMAEIYRDRRDDVDLQATELTDRLGAIATRPGSTVSPDRSVIPEAVAQLGQQLDHTYGGFGGAPKFPPSTVLEFLVQAIVEDDVAPLTQEIASLTLRRMADGGIYDQLGGGFHRYAVDDHWLVPHFEKMLYDNALLARVYLHAGTRYDEPRFTTTAEEILDYLIREMELPDGGFAAAQDADSPEGEGVYYTWTPAELASVLTPTQAALAARRFGVHDEGNFDGRSVLSAALPIPFLARELSEDPLPALQEIHAQLLRVRAMRTPPTRDDKLISSWNGLAIAAFADAGVELARTDYLDTATRAADRILDSLVVSGRLFRVLADHTAHHLAQLDDYANLIQGLLRLYTATFAPRWFTAARTLADAMVDLFFDPDTNGFYSTGRDAPKLLMRLRDLEDQPTPAGNSQAALALLHLSGLTGSDDYRACAARALALAHDQFARYPQAFGTGLLACAHLTTPSREIAVIGALEDPRTQALITVARAHQRSGLALAAADPSDAVAIGEIPLLTGRTLIDGMPAAYVCARFACQAPITDPAALRTALAASSVGPEHQQSGYP